MADFPDLSESDVGPSRGARCIDRTFTNFGESITESGTVPILEVDDDPTKRSDHVISFPVAGLESFKWITYTYCYYDMEPANLFLGVVNKLQLVLCSGRVGEQPDGRYLSSRGQ